MCEAEKDRPTVDLQYAKADARLIIKAIEFAEDRQLSLGQLIECALVNFLHNGLEPDLVRWCDVHHCALQINSSGTAHACPVEEDSHPFEVFYDR